MHDGHADIDEDVLAHRTGQKFRYYLYNCLDIRLLGCRCHCACHRLGDHLPRVKVRVRLVEMVLAGISRHFQLRSGPICGAQDFSLLDAGNFVNKASECLLVHPLANATFGMVDSAVFKLPGNDAR